NRSTRSASKAAERQRAMGRGQFFLSRAGLGLRPIPIGARARLRLAIVLLCACAARTVSAEVVFQTRDDFDVGSSPSAMTLLPGSPPILLFADSKGLAAFHWEDGILTPGARSIDGRGAQILVSGPLGAGGALAVAYASREAPRIAVAPVDAHGVVGAAETIN